MEDKFLIKITDQNGNHHVLKVEKSTDEMMEEQVKKDGDNQIWSRWYQTTSPINGETIHALVHTECSLMCINGGDYDIKSIHCADAHNDLRDALAKDIDREIDTAAETKPTT